MMYGVSPFCFIFTGKICLLQSQITKSSGKGWSNEYVPSVEEARTIHKSFGDGIHS